MPVRCDKGQPRYRVRTVRKGRQRLAFCGNKVVEAKMMTKRKKKRGSAAKKFHNRSFNSFWD
jgi:hypothetical protein